MRAGDLARFGKQLAALAEVFDTNLSEGKLALYFEALCDLALDDVLAAMPAVSRTNTFFPKPAELRAAALLHNQQRHALNSTPYFESCRLNGHVPPCADYVTHLRKFGMKLPVDNTSALRVE